MQSPLFSPRWLTAGPVEGHLKGERGSWACFKPTSLVSFSYPTWVSVFSTCHLCTCLSAQTPQAQFWPETAPLNFTWSWSKRLRNHESGDNIEQLQRQISRQVSCKHRIRKRGKHFQSVGFCFAWHTLLPGERHHWRLPDRNDHLGLRHLLPLPPSLPAHHNPHHLCSLQG